MRSFDLAIRRAYFKAQIRRNYAKNVVINRSASMGILYDTLYFTELTQKVSLHVLTENNG